MNRIFNMDNGFFRGISKLVDCIYLSVIFIITCIPVFTIGASMTAMYYTVQKVLRNDRGYVGGEYWHSFKENFKQGTVIWLIVLGIGLLFFGDMKIMQAVAKAGNPMGKISIFFVVMLMMEMIWCSYLFPYMARFSNSTKAIMKNAAYMAILNLPKTLLMILNMVVFGLVLYIIPIPGIFIVPAVYTWMQNLILEKVFRKYMSEDDRAAEDEMNREFKN